MTALTRIYIVLFACLFLFESCKKDEDPRPQFVPEEVVVVLHESCTFQSIFSLIDNYNLKIKELYEFDYFAKINKDSIDIIRSILNSKSYLQRGSKTFGLVYQKDTVTITANFFYPTAQQVGDWLNTVSILKLKDSSKSLFFKWGVISVPKDKEQYWADELKRHPEIKIAEVNAISYVR